LLAFTNGAGAGKTSVVLPVIEVGLYEPLVSGEPPGIRLEAVSSSVTFTPLMEELSPTLANGMICAPVGPTSSRSVC